MECLGIAVKERHPAGAKAGAELYLGQNPDIGPLFIGPDISFTS